MFHTEAIGSNSEEIARTSGSCHGDLTHGRGALALAYAKMMQTPILLLLGSKIGEGREGQGMINKQLLISQCLYCRQRNPVFFTYIAGSDL